MESKPRCFVCNQPSEQFPLVALEFRGKPLWICPGHMPSLIHKPEELVEKLARTGGETPGR